MRLPTFNIGAPTTLPALGAALKRAVDPIIAQLNSLSEGQASAVTNAATAAPAAGNTKTYARGDFVKNSAPGELGTAGSKYVITGWICVVAGTPGTWLACRTLTGN